MRNDHGLARVLRVETQPSQTSHNSVSLEFQTKLMKKQEFTSQSLRVNSIAVVDIAARRVDNRAPPTERGGQCSATP
jgi:hypothetical protein